MGFILGLQPAAVYAKICSMDKLWAVRKKAAYRQRSAEVFHGQTSYAYNARGSILGSSRITPDPKHCVVRSLRETSFKTSFSDRHIRETKTHLDVDVPILHCACVMLVNRSSKDDILKDAKDYIYCNLCSRLDCIYHAAC
jgi:hypothetical protein